MLIDSAEFWSALHPSIQFVTLDFQGTPIGWEYRPETVKGVGVWSHPSIDNTGHNRHYSLVALNLEVPPNLEHPSWQNQIWERPYHWKKVVEGKTPIDAKVWVCNKNWGWMPRHYAGDGKAAGTTSWTGDSDFPAVRWLHMLLADPNDLARRPSPLKIVPAEENDTTTIEKEIKELCCKFCMDLHLLLVKMDPLERKSSDTYQNAKIAQSYADRVGSPTNQSGE